MSLKLVGHDGDASGLRVLFVVHHASSRAAGASGATHALGTALAQLGCEVSYFHFDDAFPDGAASEIASAVRFPWRVSKYLSSAAAGCDVIDATTGAPSWKVTLADGQTRDVAHRLADQGLGDRRAMRDHGIRADNQ